MNERLSAENSASEYQSRAISSQSLDKRLDINIKYQQRDFFGWLSSRINVREGDCVLDVGCGTGAQAFIFSDQVGARGKVVGIDLSRESIAKVAQASRANIIPLVGEMGCLDDVLSEAGLGNQKYHMAHCSYAMPYSDDPERTLAAMADALTPDGRMVVFVPYRPHGLVEFASRHSAVPERVRQVFDYGPKILEPFFRRRFWSVSIDLFQNVVRIPTVQEVMDFYRETTYFDPASENKIMDEVQRIIERNGTFEYEKNGYLITGSEQRNS
jgi:SAM-dependent methyltransferase